MSLIQRCPKNEFNIGTVTARIGEDDQQNIFIPKLDGEKNLVPKQKPSAFLLGNCSRDSKQDKTSSSAYSHSPW